MSLCMAEEITDGMDAECISVEEGMEVFPAVAMAFHEAIFHYQAYH